MSCLLWTGRLVGDRGNSCPCLGSWCLRAHLGAVCVTARQVLWLKQKLRCHIILTEHILLKDSDPLGRSIGNHCLKGNSVHHRFSVFQPRGNQIRAFRLKLVGLIQLVIIEFIVIVHLKPGLQHSLSISASQCLFPPSVWGLAFQQGKNVDYDILCHVEN